MAAHTPDELLELRAGKFRMLGGATRLAILRSLLDGEKSVGRIVEAEDRQENRRHKKIARIGVRSYLDK